MSLQPQPYLLLVGLVVVALLLRLLFGLAGRWRLSERQRVYREYLRTEAWKKLRREALNRDGKRCRLCNASGGLQAHHRYYPEVLGTETIDALTTLCGRCHDEVAHRGRNEKGWLPFPLGHL
ncbi:MAG: hypothetical protein WCK65_14090 [Rhodospirillaceae bacterium]